MISIIFFLYFVNRVADIVPILRTAIQIAQSGTPGTELLEIVFLF